MFMPQFHETLAAWASLESLMEALDIQGVLTHQKRDEIDRCMATIHRYITTHDKEE